MKRYLTIRIRREHGFLIMVWLVDKQANMELLNTSDVLHKYCERNEYSAGRIVASNFPNNIGYYAPIMYYLETAGPHGFEWHDLD